MEMGSGASLEPISAPGGACSRCEAGERRGLFGCCGPGGCATPLPPRSATPPSTGDVSSPRPGFAAPSPQAGRSWKENFHYRDRPERCCSAPRTLRHHLETSLWGAASDRRGWRRKPRPLPPPSFSLWVAGDGGTWEENYRYHRLAGSLVSSAEPMEEVRPLIPREAPRGQAQGPPLPLRDLAYGRMLGEGHFMLHLPP
ncbi:uncharacterized protein LOC123348683 isoform X2 [Mauremys mutica]|uniref:uncharacterized protein LOC123348683 isoform X2 n=1 Tax=Mauremys mutica TaxID=74926 RepID=UPI001D1610C0|nr:uncharacterized protein LOC123348683 isoform X2 [Mauremys mutica]